MRIFSTLLAPPFSLLREKRSIKKLGKIEILQLVTLKHSPLHEVRCRQAEG